MFLRVSELTMTEALRRIALIVATVFVPFQMLRSDELQLDAAPARLSFSVSGVTFRGSGPAVVLVENGKAVRLALNDAGTPPQSARRDTPMGPADTVRHILRSENGHGVAWTVSRLVNHPGFLLQSSFTNGGPQPLMLRELVLCASESGGFSVAGDGARWWMATIGTQDQFHHRYLPAGDLASNAVRNYLDFMTIYTDRGARGLVVGAVGPPQSEVRVRYTSKDGVAALEVAADMTDIRVDPGETRQTDEVLVLAGPYDSAASSLVHWVAKTHDARTPQRPLTGWCSWYTGGPKINAARMEKIIAGATATRRNLAIDVLQIDDGWQKRYGDWTADPVKFPEGMAPTAAKIAAAGFMPGIWVAPVRSQANGKETWLDPTDPGVREQIRQSLATLVKDGYRYFKLDFNYPDLKNRHDPKKTSLQVKRDLFRLYRESLGEEPYLNACNGTAAREAIGYADAARVGTDVFDWNPKRYIGCGMVNGIEAVGSAAIVNGVWYANDPDCVKIQPIHGLLSERRTWFGFAGLGGGMVLCSDQLDNVREITKPEVMRNMEVVLPPSPEKGRIFDGNTDWWHRQFGFIAKRPWGVFGSIQLLNPTEESADVPLKGIPLDEIGSRFHLFSFWDSKYLGIADENRMIADVPMHGTAIVRLTPLSKGREPIVVGSDLHVSMGAAEIAAVEVTSNEMIVMLDGNAGARSGNLYIHSPRRLKLQSASGCQAVMTAEDGEIYRVAVSDRKRDAHARIGLGLE
jgi:alpha-galactosidase